MPDVDDIRVTLEHLTTLDLIAARRVFKALRASGADAAEARRAIERHTRQAGPRAATSSTCWRPTRS